MPQPFSLTCASMVDPCGAESPGLLGMLSVMVFAEFVQLAVDVLPLLPVALCNYLTPFLLALLKEIARPLERSLLRDTLDDARPGLEGVVINDVLMAADWKVNRVNRVVPWRGTSHINTLELGTIGILERDLAVEAPGSRFTVFVDSSVAKASSAKGRSTSLALQPGLRRAMAQQVAFDLFPAFAFAPTRLIADDPTRLVDLRKPCAVALHRLLPLPVLHQLGRVRFSAPFGFVVQAFFLCCLQLTMASLKPSFSPHSCRPLFSWPCHRLGSSWPRL